MKENFSKLSPFNNNSPCKYPSQFLHRLSTIHIIDNINISIDNINISNINISISIININNININNIIASSPSTIADVNNQNRYHTFSLPAAKTFSTIPRIRHFRQIPRIRHDHFRQIPILRIVLVCLCQSKKRR